MDAPFKLSIKLLFGVYGYVFVFRSKVALFDANDEKVAVGTPVAEALGLTILVKSSWTKRLNILSSKISTWNVLVAPSFIFLVPDQCS